MKTAGRLWLALILIGGLTMAGCSSEDGGTTDPLPDPTPPGDITVGPDDAGSMAPLISAVQSASPGFTIVVDPGSYSGTLVIDKPLTFVSSAGKDNTILTNETDTTTVLVQISGSFGSTDSLVLVGLGFNSGGRGVVVSSSTVPIAMRQCDILDNAMTGVQVGDATGKAGGDPSLSLWQCFFRRNGKNATLLPEGAGLWSTTTVIANSIFFDDNMVDLALTSAGLGNVQRMTASRSDSVCLYVDGNSELNLDGISSDTPTTLRDGEGWGAQVINSTLTASAYTVQRFESGGFDVVNSSVTFDNILLDGVKHFAIRGTDSAITLSNSVIQGTRDGGTTREAGFGVWAECTDDQSHTLLVDSSTIQESFRCGIQAVGPGQTVALQSSTLSANGLGWLNAAIENDSSAPVGGGLGLFAGATATITDSELTLNFAVIGGGVAVMGADASVTINGGELRSNSAQRLGAGILVDGGVGQINDSRLLANNSKGFGGGVAVVEGGQFTFNNTPLQSNVASSGGGGAYVFRAQASFSNNSNFLSNSAVKSAPTQPNGLGGGVYFSQADVQLDGALFEGNQGDQGGALYATTLDRDAVLRDCTFTGNKSGVNAAAVFARDLTRELRLENCEIYDNELTVPDTTVPSTIYSRQDLPGGRLVIAGCTISGNRNGAGVIGHESGVMKITETVVAYNVPAGLVGTDLGFVEMSCNDFWSNGSLNYGPGADPGPGSFSEDPLFCDRSNGVFTVDSTSPLLPANNTCGVQIGARGQGCAAKQ